jgi:hypothetical protein
MRTSYHFESHEQPVVYTELQRFISGLVILTDEVALVLSLENFGNG